MNTDEKPLYDEVIQRRQDGTQKVFRKWKNPKTSKAIKETAHAEKILQAHARNTDQAGGEPLVYNTPDLEALEASADQELASHPDGNDAYWKSAGAEEPPSPTAKQLHRRARGRRQRTKRLQPLVKPDIAHGTTHSPERA
jgi:hypothetical protein